MNQFKRAQVIILPHNNISTTITKYLPNTLSLNNNLLQPHTNQHLYIISDDEIKNRDWHLDNIPGYYNIEQAIDDWCLTKDHKKIIATTDTSLKVEGKLYKTITNLPQPSQQFIEKYIEEYNKGNVIKDVLVEYECVDFITDTHTHIIGLKINPKDNTITIKKLKDSWNREEIFELLKKAYLQGRNDGHCTFRSEELGFDNWIKENL